MHEFTHLLTNPAHWAFEAVSDVAFLIPGYIIGRWRLRVHDRRVHGKDTSN